MKDQLVKAIAHSGNIRIFVSTTTNLVEEARQRHDCWPTSAAALGRVLSVATMMGGMLKSSHEKITIQINGGGSIGTILVDAYSDGTVRGFVGDPHIHLVYNDTNKLAVGTAVGKEGYLRVIKDISLKNDFTGTVALVSGEIGEDFAYYFTVSEQTPTALSVGVLVEEDNHVSAAGGVLIQLMPSATEEDIVACEKVISSLRPVSELVSENMDAQMIAKSLFEDIEILSVEDLAFKCDCNKDRMQDALMTLDVKDLKEMKQEDHGCEVSCQYCNTQFWFDEATLDEIIQSKVNKN